MKKILTLATLSTKLTMLLCVACMGIMSAVDAVEVKGKTPCHQTEGEATETEETESCEMCKTALESLDNDGVFLAEINESPTQNQEVISSITLAYFTDTKPLLTNYQVYFPPPDVRLKAVTPITKTVVLRV